MMGMQMLRAWAVMHSRVVSAMAFTDTEAATVCPTTFSLNMRCTFTPGLEARTCDEWREACHLLVYKSVMAVVACPMPPAAAQAAIAAPHAHGAARLAWSS